MRRTLCSLAAVLAACTKPNPFLHDEGGSGSSSADGSDSGTTATATSASSSATSASSSASTSASTTTGTDDGSGSTDAGTDATATGESCPTLCVSTPGGGWNGPVAMIVTDAATTEPQCSGDFGVPSTVAYDGLAADATQCECSCGEPYGVNCATTTVYQFDAPACGVITTMHDVSGSCNNQVGNDNGNLYFQAESHTLGGQCDPDDSASVFPPAAFAVRETACALSAPDPGGCAQGEICVPGVASPFDGRLCIWAEGELGCPADGLWTEQLVRWTDWTDTRDCSQCTCMHEEVPCTGSIYLFDEANCGGLPVGNVSVGGSCTAAGMGYTVTSARLANNGLTPDPSSCDANPGNPIGGLDPGGAITFCCQG